MTRLIFLMAVISCSSCGIFRAAWWLTPNTNDYQHDTFRIIAPGEEAFQFEEGAGALLPNSAFQITYKSVQNTLSLDAFLDLHHTDAFLVIRNDSLLYTYYSPRYQEESLVTTFSLTKSVMTTLVGRAIKLGLIENIDQKVADFLPAFREDPVGEVTIRQLMLHTSGIAFSKNLFNLNSDQIQFYYGKRLQQRMSKLELYTPPGETFDYHSANTQLLGMILSKVSGLSLSEYLEAYLWQPLQMEYPAFWSLDRKDEQGTERAFCCLQANALDFSKLGRLWLLNGNWDGEQLLPEDWIATVLSLDHPEIGRYHAGLTTAGTYQYSKAFFASGLMGQIVYVVPSKQLLIVRFGEHRKNYSINLWRDVLSQVEEMF